MSTFYDLMVAAAAPKPIYNIRGNFITSSSVVISSKFVYNDLTVNSSGYVLDVFNSGIINSANIFNRNT